MTEAQHAFREIARRACAGDAVAIEQLKPVGERFIEEAARFGASPAQPAAIAEVHQAINDVLSSLERQQAEQQRSLEAAIRRVRKSISTIKRQLRRHPDVRR